MPSNTTPFSSDTTLLDHSFWDKAVAFHGHECPGLAIGYKACEAVIAEFNLDAQTLPAIDEELVCITENDACCVDAIQSLLGCTYGKANLIPRLRGKMAFSFYTRDTGKAVRLYLKPDLGQGMTRDEFKAYLIETPYTELFEIKEPRWTLPEPARHFASEICSVCGELTAEYALRLHEGKPVCLDCHDAYDREGF